MVQKSNKKIFKYLYLSLLLATCSTALAKETQTPAVSELQTINGYDKIEVKSKLLGCNKHTGSLLCNKIDHLINLFDYECRGNHCEELFESQRNELNGLTYAINFLLKYDTPIALDLYKKANQLSKEICSSQVIGEAYSITKLVIAMNSTLRGLKQIQDQLDLESKSKAYFKTHTCRMIID